VGVYLFFQGKYKCFLLFYFGIFNPQFRAFYFIVFIVEIQKHFIYFINQPVKFFALHMRQGFRAYFRIKVLYAVNNLNHWSEKSAV
jgi:hypothetical protein